VPLGDVSFAFGHHLDVHDGGEASLGTHDTAWNAKPFHQSRAAPTNTINNAGTPKRTDHPAILEAILDTLSLHWTARFSPGVPTMFTSLRAGPIGLGGD
jgi:hypothetical protein